MKILLIKNLNKIILKSVFNKGNCFYKNMNSFPKQEISQESLEESRLKRDAAIASFLEHKQKNKLSEIQKPIEVQENKIKEEIKKIIPEQLEQPKDSEYLELTDGIMNCSEYKKTIAKLIYSEDFKNINTEEEQVLQIKTEIEKHLEKNGMLEFGYDSNKIAENILKEKVAINKSEKIKEEQKEKIEAPIIETKNTEITEDEIRELNKPYLKLDGMEDDVKNYLTAKNKFSYLEQNSFEIGKSLMTMSDNAFSSIANGFVLNITKKIGSNIIISRENVGKHIEEVKYDLLKKMFPKQKILDQTALEDLLKRDNGENKKIEKLKNQYNLICNKFEEFKKLTEQKESAELIIKNFEEGESGKENIKRAKEQEKILKDLDNTELLSEINKENIALVLSILEKKRFDKETLERFWKNYGTIAKTITIGSFGILASTLALPAVAAAAVATMTFTGAYVGGSTAWKNLRENKKGISKNGNRIAFDTEELRSEKNFETLKKSIQDKIDQTKKINNEAKAAGLISGVIALGAGFGIKSILGHIDSNIENVPTNNTSNKDYLETYVSDFKPQSEAVDQINEYIPKFTPGKVSDLEWENTRNDLINNFGMSKEKAETLVRAFNRGEINSINPYQDISDESLNISKEWLSGNQTNSIKDIPVEKITEVEPQIINSITPEITTTEPERINIENHPDNIMQSKTIIEKNSNGSMKETIINKGNISGDSAEEMGLIKNAKQMADERAAARVKQNN